MKRGIFYFLCLFLIAIYLPLLAGYTTRTISKDGKETFFRGSELKRDEDSVAWNQIELATSNLIFAATKSRRMREIDTATFTNLVHIAMTVQKLLYKGSINKETSEEPNKKGYASTDRDGETEAVYDKININPRVLQAGNYWKFLLASVLAHEGEHTRIPDYMDDDWEEMCGNLKEKVAADSLIRYAHQEITDPQELRSIYNKLLSRYFTAHTAYWEHHKNYVKTKHKSGGSSFSKPVEPERVAVDFILDDIEILIASSNSFITVFHEILGWQQVNFQRIQKPLSAATLSLGGEELLVVSGTAWDDTVAIAEAFHFLRRLSEDDQQIITGIDPGSEIIFQKENVWPASVTIDERNNDIYILDSLEQRILLLKEGSLIEIANAKKLKEIKEIKTLSFGTLEGLIQFPTLGASNIPYGVDVISQSNKQFIFIDYNNDLIIDDVKTFMLRELTSYKPDFYVEPFAGEDEVFIWATFNSHVKVITETGDLLGEINRVPFEQPAHIKLTRKLQEGEVTKLVAITINKESLPQIIAAPKPTVIDVFPGIGQEMKFPTVAILGKYFVPDSRVFVLGFPGDTLVVKDDLIIARIPTFRRLEEFQPVAARIEIRSLQAGSTFVDFNYYDKDDYVRVLQASRGSMFKKRKIVMQIIKSLREDPKHNSRLPKEKINLQYIDSD